MNRNFKFFIILTSLFLNGCANKSNNQTRDYAYEFEATLVSLNVENRSNAKKMGKMYAKAKESQELSNDDIRWLMDYAKNLDITNDKDKIRIDAVTDILINLKSIPFEYKEEVLYLTSKRLQCRKPPYDATTLKLCIKNNDKSKINIAKSLMEDKSISDIKFDFIRAEALNYIKFAEQ